MNRWLVVKKDNSTKPATYETLNLPNLTHDNAKMICNVLNEEGIGGDYIEWKIDVLDDESPCPQ